MDSIVSARDSAETVDTHSSSQDSAKCRIWLDNPDAFSTERMATLHHDYHRHPLMQMSALAELAHDLFKTGQCRFLTPGATQSSEFFHKGETHDGRSIDEVFRRIEEPGSWVALYNVETNPRYRAFLNEVTLTVRALVEPQEPNMSDIGGFIFISAPPSVTPFHIDREHNFWMQVHGRKRLTVWDQNDRQVVSQPDVEKFIMYGDLANVKLRDGTLEKGTELDCGPGDGVYFPSTSPHATRSERDWTRPGDGVSVSIGVVFYTDETRRLANMHAGNSYLRKFGLKPAYPGKSPVQNSLSYLTGKSIVEFKKRFRGYEPKKGL